MIGGPAGSGKTTLALRAVAQCQAHGGRAALLDADYTFCGPRAASLHVDISKLLVVQPCSIEPALEGVQAVSLDLLVIDSIFLLDGNLPKALSNLSYWTWKTNTAVIITMMTHSSYWDERLIIRSPRWSAALRYYSSMCLNIRSASEATSALVKVTKNRCAPPYTEAIVHIG
jgi:recombination protein RecA